MVRTRDFLYLFFFQAEDGIRDRNVTGVQTCALPISHRAAVFLMELDQISSWIMSRSDDRFRQCSDLPPRLSFLNRTDNIPLDFNAKIPTISKRPALNPRDRKSTRLNSSHVSISYAVF